MKATWLVIGHLLSCLARKFVPRNIAIHCQSQAPRSAKPQNAGAPHSAIDNAFRRYTLRAQVFMQPDPSHELSVLGEKYRALQTLVRLERDIDKLQVYNCELDLVGAEFQRAVEALEKRPNAKVLRFAPKKPVRSA
jgi:hypothetical protein